MKVAILCASPRSIYKQIEGVDVYDKRRDARTFPGGCPVVAHPPCRAWSKAWRHKAKPEPGEKELGVWCAERLRECGGVLEQPAGSALFEAAGLPLPGEVRARLFTLVVEQSWWGYTVRKLTWLCFSGIPPAEIHLPFCLRDERGDRKRFENMSHAQRSRTVRPFAEWLIAAARLAG